MNGAIDTRQLDLMWQFLQFGYQKSNIPALKENCELLRKMMMQKTAGQRDNKPGDVSFGELATVINCIVIESMCLYLSGDLDAIESQKPKVEHDGCNGCKCDYRTELSYPCCDCEKSHRDLWEAKE